MAHYVHDVPGRLRVKNPQVKGNPVVASEIEQLIRTIPGVNAVSTNTTTGSVIINYDSDTVGSNRILNTLGTHGYFDASRMVTSDQYMDDKYSKAGKFISKALLGIVIEKAFEGTPLSLLSVVL